MADKITNESSPMMDQYQNKRAIASSDEAYFDNFYKENPKYKNDEASEPPTPEEKQSMVDSFVKGLEVVPAVGTGILKATQELGNTAMWAGNSMEEFMSKKLDTNIDIIPNTRMDFANNPANVYQPETTAGKIVSGFSQFFAPFAAANKVAKGARAISWASEAAKSGAIGAAIDFAAFDPHEGNLSNWINENPELRNPVTEFLAVNPKQDSEFEARLKNSLEGIGLGVATESVVNMLKWYKARRVLNSKVTDADAVVKKANQQGVDLEAPEKPQEVGQLEVDEQGAPIEGQEPPAIPKEETPNPIDDIKAEVKSERPTQMELNFNEIDEDVAEQFIPKHEKAVQAASEAEMSKSSVRLNDETVINTDAINTDKDVEEVLNSIKDFEADRANRFVDTKPMAESIEEARRIGLTEEDFLNLPEDVAFNDVEMGRFKILMDNIQDQMIRQADLLKKTTDPRQRDIVKAGLVRSRDRWRLITSRFDQAGTPVARSLNIRKEIINGPVGALNRYIDEFANADTAIDNLVEVLTDPNIDQITKGRLITETSKGIPWSDAAAQLVISGHLSSPMTHVRNVFGNAVMGGLNVGTRRMAELWSKGGADSVQKGEAKAMMNGFFSGVMDMMRVFNESRARGISKKGSAQRSFVQFTRNNLPNDRIPKMLPLEARKEGVKFDYNNVLNSKNMKNPDHWTKYIVDTLGSYSSVINKSMQTVDDVFKAMNQRMEIHALAHREAEKARLAGLSDVEVDQVYTTKLKDYDTDTVIKSGREYTFTQNIEDLELKILGGGANANNLAKSLRGMPGGRVLFPFLRTPLNISNSAIQHSPFAANLMADIRAGGVRRDMAMAKASIGTGAILSSSILAMNGMVTGAGPSDFKAKKALLESGWKEDSIKVGDTYFKLRDLGPIGDVMKLGADLTEIIGYARTEDKAKVDDALGMVVSSAITFMTPEVLSTNVMEVWEIATSGDADRMSKFIANMATPNVLRGIKEKFDPVQRDFSADPDSPIGSASQFINMIKSQIPGLSNTLPPRRNIFGEAKVAKSWAVIEPDEELPIEEEDFDSPIGKEILRLNMLAPQAVNPSNTGGQFLKLDMPPKTIVKTVGGQRLSVKLSPEEYDRFVELSGGIGLEGADATLKEVLNDRAVNEYPNMSDLAIMQDINKVVRKYRSAAKQQILFEKEDVQDDFKREITNRVMRLEL